MSQQTGQAERWLYLVQHGDAKPKTEDPDRPLSEKGQIAAEHVAAWALRRGIDVERIVHSDKLRAKQTAEIFAAHLKPSDGIDERSGLHPNEDPAALVDSLAELTAGTMLIGHLPFLSRLVGLLVTGDSERTVIRFRQAGLIGLVEHDGRWEIACVIPPEMTG